jgi:predicted transcriptional regulator
LLLLAIKPKFAAAIYVGEKRIELRRVAPRRGVPGPALIYESAPVSRITGCVFISAGQKIRPEDAASLAGPQDAFSGLYAAYVRGAPNPSALMLTNARRFQVPVRLVDAPNAPSRPPQSFCYLDGEDQLDSEKWFSWLEAHT